MHLIGFLLHAWMKISMVKTKIMCLSRYPVQCSVQTIGVSVQQIKKFKYLEVTFTSDGRPDKKWDMHIGKASAVMHQLY